MNVTVSIVYDRLWDKAMQMLSKKRAVLDLGGGAPNGMVKWRLTSKCLLQLASDTTAWT